MRRQLLLATAVLSVFALCAAAARADGPLGLLVITPRAAAHAAHISGDEVTWQSTYVWETDVGPETGLVRIDLARPIDAELDAGRSAGVSAVRDASGALVGFVVDSARLPARARQLDVSLHAALAQAGEEVLVQAPLARGDAVQRVDVVGDDDRRFEPSASLGLVHQVGFWTTPGVSNAARRACDDAVGVREVPIDDAPVYLQGTSSSASRALRGRVLTGAERARPGRVLAVLAFLVLALALGAVYPWLGRHARLEQAEAVLREEYEQVGRRPRRRT